MKGLDYMKTKKLLKNISLFLVVYAFLVCFYLLVSPGIGPHTVGLHMRRFILAAFVCVLPYYLFKKRNFVFSPPEITISLLWTTVFPLTAYLTHCKTASSLSYPYDVAIGAYMFCTLILIKALFTNYLSLVYKKIFAVFYIILQLFLFCIPISNILYYALFDAPIDSTSMMVLMQTNISEAIEYISSIPILIVITGIIIILSFLYILYRFNFKNIFSINIPTLGKRKLYFCFLLLPIGIYYTFFSLFPRTAIIKTAIDTNSYFNSTQIYKTARHNILQNLHVEKNISTDKPHTIILVIGESANRDYMHAFNSNLDNTTPWLSSHRNDFLLYSNAYSCAWNTVPALEHALTEANYYNNKPFNQSVSIIDIAKEAGYKTYWYSNQGKIGIYDTPISLVAETADISHWGTTDTPHDLGLLPYLKNINKNENNFIVLHLIGSHIDYNNRYPQEYQKWTGPNVKGRVADYKNSLLYTDKVLQSFFEYAQQNLNLDAFIYCSDHGADPTRSRNANENRILALRIPMFIYLSDAYKTTNPDITQNLSAHKNEFFSNDLLYNLVCGIFNVQSNHLEENESLTSSNYKFNIKNLKVGLGQKNVQDDPDLKL